MGGMTVQTTSGKQIMGVFGISLIVYLAGAGVVPAAAAEIDASGYPRLESFTTKAGTAFGGYTPSGNGNRLGWLCAIARQQLV